jgi:hypothetical protein
MLSSSPEELQEMITIMNEALMDKNIKVNVTKTKVLVIERDEGMTACEIFINGEKLEQVKEFVYLGLMFTKDGKCDSDIVTRVNAGDIVIGALHAFMGSRVVSKKAQFAVHYGVLLPIHYR